MTFILAATVLAAVLSPRADCSLSRAYGPPIRLAIAASTKSGGFVLTVQNTGTEAKNVNLGMTLANGASHHPTNVSLFLTAGGKSSVWEYRGSLSGVAGRVDDFIIPLMGGSSYQTSLSFDDFQSPDGARKELSSGRCRVRAVLNGKPAQSDNLDMAGVKLIKLWTGEAESNEILVDIAPGN